MAVTYLHIPNGTASKFNSSINKALNKAWQSEIMMNEFRIVTKIENVYNKWFTVHYDFYVKGGLY